MRALVVALFLLGAALCTVLGVLAWRRRGTTAAAAPLALVMAGLVTWTLAGLPGVLGLHLALLPAVDALLVAGVHVAVASSRVLYRTLPDPHFRPGRTWLAVHAVAGGLFTALALTDPWHGWFFTDVHLTGDPVHAEWVPGPAYWLHLAWTQHLLLGGLAHLARARAAASGVVRAQLTATLVSCLVPLAGSALALALPRLPGGLPTVGLLPLCFVVSGAVVGHAMLRRGFLRVVPVARGAVLEAVTDAVVVVDADGVVVDVNPTGRALLRRAAPGPLDPVGLPARTLLSGRALRELPRGQDRYPFEPVPGLHLDVRVTAITDGRGRCLGRVVVARDVTELVGARRQLEEQLRLAEQLRARLEEESVRDPLTGLHERRFLTAALGDALAAARRGGTALAVLVVDADRFKAVNDTHGHAAGDAVLVALAGALRRHVPAGGTAARCGGEEFVVLLPGAGPAAARERAEELRAACARLRVEVAPGAVVRPTVSVGTAVHPADADDAAGLLAAADAALYAAKAAGRDRVVAAGGLRVGER
ncbi:histidine kinase N-terminal 7TM domain-containing diguanylate cyclase [Kineococcus indalonis]|uniref:histidine kinase N-terminal 7TM domain-containing diguanylate cyclase n=1 Tax=Kineococcus indalonis TaxID=2696566 RepID=UPI001412D901|nr:GGDEF domain-containing protein [Kineococcus indalonis]NAZ85695.1 diguanylate cyclase [Kineococcus indalonis]